MRVLVTGASGFIGASVCRAFDSYGVDVVAAVRNPDTISEVAKTCIAVGDLGAHTAWARALAGVDAVVHLAARAHAADIADPAALQDYRSINVDATRALAEQAIAAGVPRFVFMSSIKVNGERSPCDGQGRLKPFSGADEPRPEDLYGQTKWQAEQALLELAADQPLKVIVLRPPLVYGPGVKANMMYLFEVVARGFPLPLASIRNRRSLIFSENLADAVVNGAAAAVPAGVYTLDDVQISTPDLVRVVARALGRPPRLFPFPPALLMGTAALMGKRRLARGLTESLVVQSDSARKALSWSPRVSFEDAMMRTAAWFRGRLHADR